MSEKMDIMKDVAKVIDGLSEETIFVTYLQKQSGAVTKVGISPKAMLCKDIENSLGILMNEVEVVDDRAISYLDILDRPCLMIFQTEKEYNQTNS